MQNVVRNHNLKVALYTQVLGITPNECANPVLTAEEIESGQFLCEHCDKEHDFLRFKFRDTDTDREADYTLNLMLCDGDARVFARECARLLESSCGSMEADCGGEDS